MTDYVVVTSGEAGLPGPAGADGAQGPPGNPGGITDDHGALQGLGDNDHPQYLLVVDIDDVPVDGVTNAPISSNWAFDHLAAADPHPGYLTPAEGNAAYDPLGAAVAAIIAHEAAADPHPQYLTLAEGNAAFIDSAELAAAIAAIDHGALTGLADNDHPQYLLVADIDDVPVDGVVNAPISSNWAFDHLAAADPHPGYVTTAEQVAYAQPLDSDLTALAGLATTTGNIIYANGGTWTVLPIGSAGEVLTVNAGLPAWDPASGGVTFPLLAPNGSASAPSYSFTSSSGSGVWYTGTGVAISDDNAASIVTVDTDITLTAAGNVVTNGVDVTILASDDFLTSAVGDAQVIAGAAALFGSTAAAATVFGSSVVVQSNFVTRITYEPDGSWNIGGSNGTSGQVITSNGSAAAPTWQTPTTGVTDHGALTGLVPDDDHTQYALLAGRASGQTLVGGTGASENLTLRATANAANGEIIFQTDPTTEAARFTAANVYVQGNPSAVAIGAFTPNHQVVGAGSGPAWSLNGQFSNDVLGAFQIFSKSRNSTVGGHGAVVLDDYLGGFIAYASDGAAFNQRAVFSIRVDNTVLGARLQFDLADPSGSVTPRFAVNSEGAVGVESGGVINYGTSGQVLTSAGAAAEAAWVTPTGGVTFPLLAPNGSASAPSYSFTSSSDSGVFYDGTGVVLSDDNASSFVSVSGAGGIGVVSSAVLGINVGSVTATVTGTVFLSSTSNVTLLTSAQMGISSSGSNTIVNGTTGLLLQSNNVTRITYEPDGSWNIGGSNGTTGQVITSNGSAAAPTWQTIDHGALSGLADNDHPQYLLVADIDDTPVNGELAQPISSNWAFDHLAAADPHPGYTTAAELSAAVTPFNTFDIQITTATGFNGDITVLQHAGFAFTVNQAWYQTDSGTISANVKIEGTSITGLSALALTSTEANSTASAANTVAAGNTVKVTLTSNATAVNASITLHCTRT